MTLEKRIRLTGMNIFSYKRLLNQNEIRPIKMYISEKGERVVCLYFLMVNGFPPLDRPIGRRYPPDVGEVPRALQPEFDPRSQTDNIRLDWICKRI